MKFGGTSVGSPERIRALRFFFETYPEYRERLVFVQLAAPSRGMIDRYQEIQREVEESVRELNQAFQTKTWRPFLYLKAHHEHRDCDCASHRFPCACCWRL